MSITYPNYQTTNRVPGVFADIDPTFANDASTTLRSLIIGQRLKAGSAPAGTPVIIPSPSVAVSMFGAGSQAAIMVSHYRNIDTFGELWVLPLDDDAAAIPAKGAIALSGTPTGSGTIVFEIDGALVPVVYNAGDAPADIVARIPVAMAQVANIPVAAGDITDASLPLTALNAGECGNDILLGTSDTSSDYTSDGITITFTQLTGGSENPSAALTPALANLGDRTFDFVACGYTDATSLAAMEEFWNDQTGRWSWLQMLFGHVYNARRGTLGEITTFAATVNDQHHSIMPIADSPHSPIRWAAEIAAGVANKARNDPGLPLTQIALTVMPPSLPSRWTFSEQNSLLYEGMSTFSVGDDDTVYILRMVTTYQEDASGMADDAYLDAETMNQLAYVIRDLRAFQAPYLTKKLVSDTTRIAAGSDAISASVVKQALISRYATLETAGYVQNSANFAAGILVQNAGGGQLRELLPVDVVNQVRDIPMLIQFRKS
ncbi:phage tail sheath subtilisin-like domain-containing protein [Komagataeibacter xylinus]|uniref:Phage tail protein n=1 Tax=Komagataeibacter xylinus TaxID=28448 RepID=A0A857FSE4_KOMXY|nr:phage tail sheath subtilisin-like domain-containing protein [Komagataeibacter xylinus]QHC36459.1 phage tail protein [Komagataeibacter xylinus]